MQQQTRNILHEWELPKNNDGLVKLYAEEISGKLYLYVLTTSIQDNLCGFETSKSIEQLKRLSADKALRHYAKLLAASIGGIQKRLSKGAC